MSDPGSLELALEMKERQNVLFFTMLKTALSMDMWGIDR